jgi:hypothetical protein
LAATLPAHHLYFNRFVAHASPQENEFVNKLIFLVLTGLLAAGCVTSTVESRSRERAAAYAALSPEWRDLVNQGQIKVGMSMDAVYVAWGKPSQILTSESTGGTTTTWRYQGLSYQEYRYWSQDYYGSVRHRNGYGYYASPRLEYDYVATPYVAAEVIFEKGIVKSWQNLAQQKK